MITLQTAQALKDAGLSWQPTLHDFFAIPERGLDDRMFVLSDMTVGVEVLHGFPAITFNGAVEWSLDFIYQFDVVWLPREDQLRELLLEWLSAADSPAFELAFIPGGYRCTVQTPGGPVSFEGSNASESYASALLHFLHPADT